MGGYSKFEFQTSGSTGTPKEIILTREQLEYSAIGTLDILFPEQKPKNLLLCINPKFIGGTQIITRTLLSESDLIIMEACANPLEKLNNSVDLASMVPLQIETILEEDQSHFDKVGTVLIGGAPLNPNTRSKLSKLKTRFFETYGMTETASHVALKSVQDESFSFFGDIEYRVDERGCLALKGTVTNQVWIQSNDVVELKPQGFNILGRADWVINSGGVKIHPEIIEQKISSKLENSIAYVSSVKDGKLGERAILCSQKALLSEIKKERILDKYETPKEELIFDEFPFTGNGKIDRNQLQLMVKSRLG